MQLFCDVLVRAVLIYIGWKLAEFLDKHTTTRK